MNTPFGPGHHLHLIDGSAFIFRAFHALPPLSRKSDGVPIGAVSGFCNMLWKMVEDNARPDAPTHVAVIFDKGSHTFRNDLYPLYKANREEMPADLRPQIPLTREAVRAFNIACIEKDGFEADDIIATYARQAEARGGRVTIVSSDKDLMQLVGPAVEMFDAMKSVRLGVEEVETKFGVRPERVIDVQALAGDSVDNVPGAPGIGVKTAAQLIVEYGDLDTLLERAEEIKQPKRRQTLVEHADQIRLSRELVTLDPAVPDLEPLDGLDVRAAEEDALLGFLGKMEFRTLTRRVAEAFGAEMPETSYGGGGPEGAASPLRPGAAVAARDLPFVASRYVTVRDLSARDAWIGGIAERGYVAIDT
ncbi:MAG: 5'-3' exonuclease H3TH domain-containing protein, partial [Pseudomonadota bacterium]